MQEIIKELEDKANHAIDAFSKAISRLRTGRANVSILDAIRVDAYGSKSPINQLASVNVADPKLIVIKPFDKSLMGEIERALRSAQDLGISPQSDGEKILLPIPALTEERRREFTKVAKTKAEDAKVSVRNARRDANERLKVLEKDGVLPKDDAKKAMDRVQKLTDDFVHKIDDITAKKEREIMEV